MQWRQLFFRTLGAVSFVGGVYAFLDFGRELLPAFSDFVAGRLDVFHAFATISAFFFGACALIWIGIRMIALRNFKTVWLYGAMFSLTTWLHELYALGPIPNTDVLVSQSIVYLCLYGVIVFLAQFIHTKWFVPISHEDDRYVALEKADASLLFELRWVILVIILVILLILHPAPIGETIDMIITTIVYVFNLLR